MEMETTYHIGDIFEVPGGKVLAIIVNVNSHAQYSVRYVLKTTHEIYEGRTPKNAWWSAEELKKTFKERRIFRKNK